MSTPEPARDRYLIDTSSLVGVERLDAPDDEREEVWRMIIDLLERRRMQLLDRVLDELRRNAAGGTDDTELFRRAIEHLRAWRRAPATLRTKGTLTPMDLQHLADITERFPKMSSVGMLGERADPYLVCVGLTGGYVVVTEESPDSPQRIPAACAHFDVDCINLAKLIEREMHGDEGIQGE